DLALPLVLYTVATVARRRGFAIALLGFVMVLVYAAMLDGRVQADSKTTNSVKQDQQGAVKVVTEVSDSAPAVKPAPKLSKVWIDSLVDTSQAVLEMWLLLVVAYAVGDGVRSRRAHLAAVEQRTADLAREERQRAALAVAAE